MAAKDSASVRRENTKPSSVRPLLASPLERTLAEMNQIQRSMGVGATKRHVERVYIRVDAPNYQFRD
jgi:hypothetical protein